LARNDHFLTLEKAVSGWQIGVRHYSTLYIRQAYKDHWGFIKNNSLPRGGINALLYSMEARALGNPLRQFTSSIVFLNHPLILCNCNECQMAPGDGNFPRFLFDIPNHIDFKKSQAYKIMSANKPVWNIYDSTMPTLNLKSLVSGPHYFCFEKRW
jgi:hypothetical protein